MLEAYRSSQASFTNNKITIESTTDPQGTGIQKGSNNDFPDYYNRFIRGTKFGNAVEENGLLKMNGTQISRENNDVLSALRSLSFLKLILIQKGITQEQFEKMDVKVIVGGMEVTANMGEVPVESMHSSAKKLAEDRETLRRGDINNYSIQVTAGKNESAFEEDQSDYTKRGWTYRTENAGNGFTRLLVEGFTDVDDAITKLEIIRIKHPKAFIKGKE